MASILSPPLKILSPATLQDHSICAALHHTQKRGFAAGRWFCCSGKEVSYSLQGEANQPVLPLLCNYRGSQLDRSSKNGPQPLAGMLGFQIAQYLDPTAPPEAALQGECPFLLTIVACRTSVWDHLQRQVPHVLPASPRGHAWIESRSSMRLMGAWSAKSILGLEISPDLAKEPPTVCRAPCQDGSITAKSASLTALPKQDSLLYSLAAQKMMKNHWHIQGRMQVCEPRTAT